MWNTISLIAFWFLEVTVSSDEFLVGSRAVANCSSSADSSSIDTITWTNSRGDVLASAVSANQLELVFDPVTDDDSLQGETLTCSAQVGQNVANGSFRVALVGMCMHVCILHR